MDHSLLIALVLAVLAVQARATQQQSDRPFQSSVLTYPNGTEYSLPLALTIAFSPTNPDLLLVGDIPGALHLLRVKKTTSTTYVVTRTEDRVTFGENRNILGLASDPFDPTVFFVSTVTIGWQARGLGPAGWQNGKVERVRVLRKTAKLLKLGTLVSGLPVSNRQTSNGVFSPVVDSTDGTLYVPVSTGTGLGIAGKDTGGVPDTILSSSVLKVDIRSPDKTRALKWSSDKPRSARLVDPPSVTGVRVFATGVRSAFQLVYSADGRLLATDGGANLSDERFSATCQLDRPLKAPEPDRLVVLKRGRYYGTPNRVRGATDPEQCVYIRPTATVDLEMFPTYEPPLATTAGAVERGDLVGGVTGFAQYDFAWAPAVARGSLIASGFETPKNADEPGDAGAGILWYDFRTRRYSRAADSAGATVAVDVAGTLFTALTTSGRIGVHTPVVSEQRQRQRRIAGVWPARGTPGSRLHVVGTRLPVYQRVLVGGVPCTRVRRLRRYPGVDVVSCRVPRLARGQNGRVDVRIGFLTLRHAFTVL